MDKMCLAYFVALLVALHLISTQVVQAQDRNVSFATIRPTVKANGTNPAGNGCGRTDAFTLLLPLAVAASLLSWS